MNDTHATRAFLCSSPQPAFEFRLVSSPSQLLNLASIIFPSLWPSLCFQGSPLHATLFVAVAMVSLSLYLYNVPHDAVSPQSPTKPSTAAYSQVSNIEMDEMVSRTDEEGKKGGCPVPPCARAMNCLALLARLLLLFFCSLVAPLLFWVLSLCGGILSSVALLTRRRRVRAVLTTDPRIPPMTESRRTSREARQTDRGGRHHPRALKLEDTRKLVARAQKCSDRQHEATWRAVGTVALGRMLFV
jgi:hypothetical protein